MTDHLTPAGRAAHDRMLDAFDRLMRSVLDAEGEAMTAKLRAEGKTHAEAAEGARAHVNRVMIEMQRERARLEAEAVAHMH